MDAGHRFQYLCRWSESGLAVPDRLFMEDVPGRDRRRFDAVAHLQFLEPDGSAGTSTSAASVSTLAAVFGRCSVTGSPCLRNCDDGKQRQCHFERLFERELHGTEV